MRNTLEGHRLTHTHDGAQAQAAAQQPKQHAGAMDFRPPTSYKPAHSTKPGRFNPKPGHASAPKAYVPCCRGTRGCMSFHRTSLMSGRLRVWCRAWSSGPLVSPGPTSPNTLSPVSMRLPIPIPQTPPGCVTCARCTHARGGWPHQPLLLQEMVTDAPEPEAGSQTKMSNKDFKAMLLAGKKE